MDLDSKVSMNMIYKSETYWYSTNIQNLTNDFCMIDIA